MVCSDGREHQNARFLKSTIDTEVDKLVEQAGSAEQLLADIINSDPEIDLERVGMQLTGVRKIYISDMSDIVHSIHRNEVVFTPNGELKESRPYEDVESNINTDIPLRWTGKLIPKQKAVRMFVFSRKYQIKHINGLTYDFLYDMAKQLSEKGAVMLLGAGSKGVGPVVLSNGGVSYRAFLEGRISDDGKYCLILHLTNLELKAIA